MLVTIGRGSVSTAVCTMSTVENDLNTRTGDDDCACTLFSCASACATKSSHGGMCDTSGAFA